MSSPKEKKEKKQILTAIKESVMKSPKSMYELAKELESNWDTIKFNVIILKDLGIVEMQDQKVIYVQKNIIVDADNFAGLPISEEMRKKVYAIAQQFVNEWNKKGKKKITNTILQKAMVEIADSFPKLEIPRGWYIYGKVILVKLTQHIFEGDSQHTYNFSSEIPDIKKLNQKIQV